jgi:hypothetical protein
LQGGLTEFRAAGEQRPLLFRHVFGVVVVQRAPRQPRRQLAVGRAHGFQHLGVVAQPRLHQRRSVAGMREFVLDQLQHHPAHDLGAHHQQRISGRAGDRLVERDVGVAELLEPLFRTGAHGHERGVQSGQIVVRAQLCGQQVGRTVEHHPELQQLRQPHVVGAGEPVHRAVQRRR